MHFFCSSNLLIDWVGHFRLVAIHQKKITFDIRHVSDSIMVEILRTNFLEMSFLEIIVQFTVGQWPEQIPNGQQPIVTHHTVLCLFVCFLVKTNIGNWSGEFRRHSITDIHGIDIATHTSGEKKIELFCTGDPNERISVFAVFFFHFIIFLLTQTFLFLFELTFWLILLWPRFSGEFREHVSLESNILLYICFSQPNVPFYNDVLIVHHESTILMFDRTNSIIRKIKFLIENKKRNATLGRKNRI